MASKEAPHASHPSDQWVARFYREGDDEGILDLLVAAFGSWPLHDITVPPVEHLVRLFGEQATRPYDLIDAQCKDLLNWRFCDPRAGRWTVHTAEEDGRLLGYISYRISKGRGLVGGLLALPDRLDVIESLLEESLRSLHRQGIGVVQCWCAPRHPYRAVLERVGIGETRRTVHLVINAAGEEFTFLEDPAASVHVVAGDTDHV
jgi:hypothetical protein